MVGSNTYGSCCQRADRLEATRDSLTLTLHYNLYCSYLTHVEPVQTRLRNQSSLRPKSKQVRAMPTLPKMMLREGSQVHSSTTLQGASRKAHTPACDAPAHPCHSSHFAWCTTVLCNMAHLHVLGTRAYSSVLLYYFKPPHDFCISAASTMVSTMAAISGVKARDALEKTSRNLAQLTPRAQCKGQKAGYSHVNTLRKNNQWMSAMLTATQAQTASKLCKARKSTGRGRSALDIEHTERPTAHAHTTDRQVTNTAAHERTGS